jgi:putative transposase
VFVGNGLVDGVDLSNAGEIVLQTWETLPLRFPMVILDAFVVMPNHAHGILMIADTGMLSVGKKQGAASSAPTNGGGERNTPTLGKIMRSFKSISAIACNRVLERNGVPFWQRNYYERAIRNEDELNRFRQYIENNPIRWAEDHNNPTNFR